MDTIEIIFRAMLGVIVFGWIAKKLVEIIFSRPDDDDDDAGG